MQKKSTVKKSISVITALIFIFTLVISAFPVGAVTYTYYTLTYEAGDYSDVVGSSSVSFERIEGVSFDVAATSRFSRKGYKIISWTVKSTGEVVAASSQYTMPSHDITFVANWSPVTYDITLAGVGGTTSDGSANTTIKGTCGETIILPESPFTKSGYTFAGWKYSGVTYNAGDEFVVPGVLTGRKIVISAVWKSGSAVTTAATTTTTTTTTTITTPAQTENSDSSVSLPDNIQTKNYTVNKLLNSDNNSYKIYLYKLIKTNYTVYKVEFNFSADCEDIGTVSMSIGTNLKDDSWYQKDLGEEVKGNKLTVDFGDVSICNNLRYTSSFQIGYWYGVNDLTLDSITILYTQPETVTTTSTTAATTTTEVTTISETTTETTATTEMTTSETTTETTATTEMTTSETTTDTTTTTEVTTSETTTETTATTEMTTSETTTETTATTEMTTSETTTETTSTTEMTTSETTTETTSTTEMTTSETTTETTKATTTTAASTLPPSQYSKVVDINREIGSTNGNMLTLDGSELFSAYQIPESLEITISANGNPIENYNLAVFMNLENNGFYQENASNYTSDGKLVLQLTVTGDDQLNMTNNSKFNIGYWWGTNSDITIETVKVNYRIDNGDYNSDGIVDMTDAEILRKYMIGSSVENFDINSENADINDDDSINVFDYMELTRSIN